MNENLKNIFIEQFLKQFDDKEQKKILLSRDQQVIVERKNKRLDLIRQFLNHFTEQGVKVHHKDRFNKEILNKQEIVKEEQEFKYYDADTSAAWAPGISIWFDHPAEIEIAVPTTNMNAFMIKVASPHPKAHFLNQQYDTLEGACQALAKFIVENTTSVNPDYKKILKEYEKENNLAKNLSRTGNTNLLDKNFFSRVPSTPPETSSSKVAEKDSNSSRTFGQFAHTQPVKNDIRQDSIQDHAKENKDSQKD